VAPDLLLLFDPFVQFLLAGQMGFGPNDGNTADGSPGTAQLGSLSLAPTLVFLSPFLGSSVELGGASWVDGAGTNSAAGSPGTAQAGGGNAADGSVGTVQVGGATVGNAADDSAGTVQVGGATVAPTLAASTPVGNADLGGASGADGGSNQSSDSTGTVQVGGGNTANGSTGAVQASGVTVEPTFALTQTPADVSLGGSSGIAGGGNDASGSAGTVQAGGGNSADASNGAVQTGPVFLGQTLTVDGAPVGGGTAGGTAESTGAAAGVADVSASAPSGSLGSGRATPVPTRKRGIAQEPVRSRRTTGGPPATEHGSNPGSRALRLAERAGTLPFTGLDLPLFLALGLGLGLAGLGLRAYAER
jgi:hypothetical protein